MDDNTSSSQIAKLEHIIASVHLPNDLKDKSMAMITRLKTIEKDASFFLEYDNAARYFNWITSLPWNNTSQDILDLNHAKSVLDKYHYGLGELKERILEYISVMILKKNRGDDSQKIRAPILSLVGLVGTGKTTIAYSTAEALGRKIARIPFGGMGGSAMIRGQSRIYADAEPGYVMKALRRVGSNNPVILLDEIDRVNEATRTDIMGVLIELLDPEQNNNFTDHFIDYPFDLSKVMFITTSNNTKDISTAVLDRLEVIQMPSYNDNEKKAIGRTYMFPKVLRDSGLTEQDLLIEDAVWDKIIRPLGYDPGIRTLQRTIDGVVRKVAKMIVEGKVPAGQQFRISDVNIKEFVPQW